MNTFLISKKQKQFIKDKLYGGNRSIVWCFAPGYSDGEKNNILNIEELTNFKIKKVEAEKEIVIIGEDFSYQVDNRHEKSLLKEIFVPDEGEILGSLSFATGLACKKLDDYTLYFSALPLTTPEVYRSLFTKSGVHLYHHENDSLLEGSGLILMHTEHGGDRKIMLLNGSTVCCTLKESETIIIDSENGDILRRG